MLLADRYRLGAMIGRGGMGRVWQAQDELLGRRVAVKELTAVLNVLEEDRAVLQDRMQQEARAAARINHPCVVTVYDVVVQDDRPWIVMELVDGRSLADAIKENGSLSPREAASIGAHVLDALRAAHSSNVIHRDVKPDNILLARDGRVLLTDFGIALIEGDPALTRTGELVGSLDYLAPERTGGGRPGPESDLWSLGAALYAAVEGVSPFRRTSVLSTMHAVVMEEPPEPHNAGPLAPVITALLRKEPGERPSAGEAARLLRRVADGQSDVVDHVPAGQGAAVAQSTSRASASTAAARTRFTAPATREIPQPEEHQPGQAAPVRRRRRTILMIALTLVVLGTGGTITYLKSLDGSRQASTTLRPESTSPPEASPPKSGSLNGSHRLSDPWGFSLVVPDGFTRSVESPRVFYYSAGKEFRLGIRNQEPDPNGPLAVMRKLDAAGPGAYKGYRDGIVSRTTQNGRPAALWEFTWNGFTGKDPRRTYDLCWTEGGRQYDIWISSPIQKTEQGRSYFETARATFKLR
ncbi:serine/threonine-protein kinase [Streptomyces sp. NPDC086787]|uniref:serine/threonine-protein kinase n=1 Tax=Streptomyces sp. NPDC086787 TaxID=3365759 RepID=UPI0038109B81